MAAVGTAPLSTTAWPSLAPCWTKVHMVPVMANRAEVAAQGCGCSRAQSSFPPQWEWAQASSFLFCLCFSLVLKHRNGTCGKGAMLITIGISHVGPFQCSPTLKGAPGVWEGYRITQRFLLLPHSQQTVTQFHGDRINHCSFPEGARTSGRS